MFRVHLQNLALNPNSTVPFSGEVLQIVFSDQTALEVSPSAFILLKYTLDCMGSLGFSCPKLHKGLHRTTMLSTFVTLTTPTL